ncbi:hypothetical protein A2678_01405 [Candidatus Kaiserbacteria bacterium RIFCSPHIGHO2_01_FULL_53_31]|uniref:ATP synthase subunit delta n=1 Tax=Candidatus Kaiserbacteria bacterium RIFCSPHIGHO2_01_FULL_53_31 TaxID=1798481 RepID=A0A1F6CH72_9BACT|nr:MAG: hypothetical protein A2678_01405 [Candidatus Kaiserbacteria bacterium RIFCSPHIGHO2_01_FULL_53_31]
MTRALLDTLTEHTYSRSDFAYRLNLIREFLEFVFFTKRDVRASREVVGAFASHSNNPTADIAYLQSLPSSFLETFTQESFYATLDQLAEECTQLQTLSLTLPVVLARADVDAIGVWARRNVSSSLMITVDIDRTVSVGCRIIWNNQLHDFGFDQYVTQHETALRTSIHTKIEQSMSVAHPHT